MFYTTWLTMTSWCTTDICDHIRTWGSCIKTFKEFGLQFSKNEVFMFDIFLFTGFLGYEAIWSLSIFQKGKEENVSVNTVFAKFCFLLENNKKLGMFKIKFLSSRFMKTPSPFDTHGDRYCNVLID